MADVPDTDLTRCAKKGIVIMELFSRIMQDLIKTKTSDIVLIRKRVEKNHQTTPNDKGRKLSECELDRIKNTDIREWDVSLCMAVFYAAQLSLNDHEKDYAGRMVKERNLMFHGTCFRLTAEDERMFYTSASIVAQYFQIHLDPENSYTEELNNIRRKDLSQSQSVDVIDRVKSEEDVAEVPQSTLTYKLVVGIHFPEILANCAHYIELVVVFKSQANSTDILEWFKTHGRSIKIGKYEIHLRVVETGSVVLYITISTSESSFDSTKIYEAVIKYVSKPLESKGKVPETAIEILMYFDDTKML